MADDLQQLRTFFEAWSTEFEKSVEMFTGQSTKLEPGEPGKDQAFGGNGRILWQGQMFEQDGTGSAWIGTLGETCDALMEGAADDSEGRESLYREALQQSFEGAAHILSSGRSTRMTCKQPKSSDTAPTASWMTVWLVTPAWRSPVLVGIDSDFAALLRRDDSPASKPPLELQKEPFLQPDDGSRFNRLVDLELPIAIVLGRARLQIRDVLKLTAGSLVELDRRIGEPVEIVVHQAVVARGEVVSISGNYGVRITEVMSRTDRMALRATVAAHSSRAPLSTAVH